MSPKERIGMKIKSDHPWAFKSGSWGVIRDVVPANQQQCYLIEWPEGEIDLWLVNDTLADYQFQP